MPKRTEWAVSNIFEAAHLFHPNRPWRLPFSGGFKFETSSGMANLDGAAFFYYFAICVTPAMAEEMVGKGLQYAIGKGIGETRREGE